MPVANVTTKWVDGNLVFYDVSKNIIATWDGTNRKLSFPSGSTLEVLGTATVVDSAFEAADMALATGSILIGTANKAAALDAKGDGKILIGNGTTAAMQTVGTDATLSNAGALTIANGAVTLAKMANMATASVIYRKTGGAGAPEVQTLATLKTDLALTGADLTDASITSAKLANGAGVAALLTNGLGGSVSCLKTDAATKTIVAAHGTKDRACLVLVTVDETYAIGTGTLPTVEVGEDDTIDKCMAHTVLDTEAAGTVLAFAFTNTATKKIIATCTAAVGNATGGCSITVLAIPTT